MSGEGRMRGCASDNVNVHVCALWEALNMQVRWPEKFLTMIFVPQHDKHNDHEGANFSRAASAR